MRTSMVVTVGALLLTQENEAAAGDPMDQLVLDGYGIDRDQTLQRGLQDRGLSAREARGLDTYLQEDLCPGLSADPRE